MANPSVSENLGGVNFRIVTVLPPFSSPLLKTIFYGVQKVPTLPAKFDLDTSNSFNVLCQKTLLFFK